MSAGKANHDLFSVKYEVRDNAVHLRLSGELDIATAPVLDRWLSGAESNGYSGIVLDLEELTFIDASGLHAFDRAAGRAGRSGKTFAIVKVPAGVRRVLDIAGAPRLSREAASAVP